MLRFSLMLAGAALVSALISVGSHFLLRQEPPAIATVQLHELIAENVATFGKEVMTEEERTAKAQRFAKALDIAIKDISQQHRVTLLVSPAVVSPAVDMTAEIKSRIESGMKQLEQEVTDVSANR